MSINKNSLVTRLFLFIDIIRKSSIISVLFLKNILRKKEEHVETYPFFVFMLGIAISAFIAGLAYQYMKRLSIISLFIMGFLMVGLFAERENQSERSPAKITFLEHKSRWEVLLLGQSEGKYIAILKNLKTRKISTVILEENPPEKFTVKKNGWWLWQKTTLVAIKETGREKNE